MFVFSKINAYGDYIAANVTDHCYDLGVKGQGKIYKESEHGSLRISCILDIGASYFVQ